MSSETEIISPATLVDVQTACAESVTHAQSFYQAALWANAGQVQEAAAGITEVYEDTEDPRLLFMAFQFYFRTGDVERAKAVTITRITLAGRDGQLGIEARARCNLGLICLTQGDMENAMQYGKQALAIDERLEDQIGIARDLGHIANVHEAMGELDQAQTLNLRGLAIAKGIGAHEIVAGKLANLGDIAHARGNVEEASQLWQEALDLFERIGVRKWHSQLRTKLRTLPDEAR